MSNAFDEAADLFAREVQHVLGASEATQRTYLSAEVIEAAYADDDGLIEAAIGDTKVATRALMVSAAASKADSVLGMLLRAQIEATVLARLVNRADQIQLTFPEFPERDERAEADEEYDRL